MISFEQSTVIILILYGCATIGGIAGMLLRQRWLRIVAVSLSIGSFLWQTFEMAGGSHATMPQGLSWGQYLQILAWFIVLCSLAGLVKLRSSTPTLFVTPLALMLYLMSYRFLDLQITLPKELGASFYTLHIGALYLSLALIALAFAAGIIFIYVDNLIKSKLALPSFIKDLPALAILDKINALAVIIGFPLFTVGIVSGFIWAGIAWKQTLSGDPKEVVSIFIWALYAIVFHARIILGKRGRKPALMIIWLFGLSVFSILVVNSFMDTHHSFTLQRQ